MTRTNRTRYTVLACLSVRPMSGYDVKQYLEGTVAHFWSESYGQIYPVLHALEEEGAITGRDDEGRPGRTRRVYTLTTSGLGELRGWLREPPEPEVPRYEISLKLFFGDQIPLERSLEHLRAHRARHAEQLARYREHEAELTSAADAPPGRPYRLAVLRGGIRYAGMVVAWCDETIAALETLEASDYPAPPPAPVEPMRPVEPDTEGGQATAGRG